LYWSIIRPTVTYACETWVLKETINPLNAQLNPTCHLLALLGAHHILHVSRIRVKKRLMVFERKVLRRIFGPTKERYGTWRIKTNDKLDELIGH